MDTSTDQQIAALEERLSGLEQEMQEALKVSAELKKLRGVAQMAADGLSLAGRVFTKSIGATSTTEWNNLQTVITELRTLSRP